MSKYCRNCGNEITGDATFCNRCGSQIIDGPITSSSSDASYSTVAKSKIIAGLFGIFFGAFGVHNFYLGFTGKAIAQLLITILSCGILSGISALWGFIEGILILTGSIDKDAKGIKLKD